MNEINQIDTETAVEIDETRGKLAAAVAAVMAHIMRLEKADNNAFAKYRFTSVDDYKDALRPLMAKNGLSVGMSQVGFERFTETKDKNKESTHCQYDFELWLEHESGEVGKPEGSTVCLPYVGAQTTGQARSYAQKEWLKSKFLASSGDRAEDADSAALDIQLPKAEARKLQSKMDDEMRAIGKNGTVADLKDWYARNEILIQAMPNDWTVYLRSEYQNALLEIKAREKGVEVGPKLPNNVEDWLANLGASLADCTTPDELEHMWSEVQDVALALPVEEGHRAFTMLEKHQDRLAAA